MIVTLCDTYTFLFFARVCVPNVRQLLRRNCELRASYKLFESSSNSVAFHPIGIRADAFVLNCVGRISPDPDSEGKPMIRPSVACRPLEYSLTDASKYINAHGNASTSPPLPSQKRSSSTSSPSVPSSPASPAIQLLPRLLAATSPAADTAHTAAAEPQAPSARAAPARAPPTPTVGDAQLPASWSPPPPAILSAPPAPVYIIQATPPLPHALPPHLPRRTRVPRLDPVMRMRVLCGQRRGNDSLRAPILRLHKRSFAWISAQQAGAISSYVLRGESTPILDSSQRKNSQEPLTQWYLSFRRGEGDPEETGTSVVGQVPRFLYLLPPLRERKPKRNPRDAKRTTTMKWRAPNSARHPTLRASRHPAATSTRSWVFMTRSKACPTRRAPPTPEPVPALAAGPGPMLTPTTPPLPEPPTRISVLGSTGTGAEHMVVEVPSANAADGGAGGASAPASGGEEFRWRVRERAAAAPTRARYRGDGGDKDDGEHTPAVCVESADGGRGCREWRSPAAIWSGPGAASPHPSRADDCLTLSAPALDDDEPISVHTHPLPPEDYRRMSAQDIDVLRAARPSPPALQLQDSPSFSAELSGAHRFFQALRLLPWVATDRVTADYHPKAQARGGESWYHPRLSPAHSHPYAQPPAPRDPPPRDNVSRPALAACDAAPTLRVQLQLLPRLLAATSPAADAADAVAEPQVLLCAGTHAQLPPARAPPAPVVVDVSRAFAGIVVAPAARDAPRVAFARVYYPGDAPAAACLAAQRVGVYAARAERERESLAWIRQYGYGRGCGCGCGGGCAWPWPRTCAQICVVLAPVYMQAPVQMQYLYSYLSVSPPLRGSSGSPGQEYTMWDTEEDADKILGFRRARCPTASAQLVIVHTPRDAAGVGGGAGLRLHTVRAADAERGVCVGYQYQGLSMHLVPILGFI
ncbi:hypothetical protein B0H11DRAFT_1913038 [Mycena galericulata]|nr:hypothetical protein B0H11DRAFT_1913038 [Mycena galericulata]